MATARNRRERGVDYWPGFVDALATLVLATIFLLTVFVMVQFFLSQEVAGKDTALVRLNVQIAQLTDLLALEKTGKVDMEEEIARLRANLSGIESERDRLKASVEGAGARPGRSPQSTDRGAAPPAGGARAGPRRLGKARQGVPDPHRRPRPAAQYSAGPTGAG